MIAKDKQQTRLTVKANLLLWWHSNGDNAVIELKDIQPKARRGVTGVGTGHPFSHTVYNADIEPGESIRLHGIHQKKPFDVTFKVGDIAEYDSYNLHYTGQIVKITQNTITINASRTGDRNKRLTMYEFCWRNYDFNEAEVAAKNMDTMQYI
jgi:hypothetical protein